MPLRCTGTGGEETEIFTWIGSHLIDGLYARYGRPEEYNNLNAPVIYRALCVDRPYQVHGSYAVGKTLSNESFFFLHENNALSCADADQGTFERWTSAPIHKGAVWSAPLIGEGDMLREGQAVRPTVGNLYGAGVLPPNTPRVRVFGGRFVAVIQYTGYGPYEHTPTTTPVQLPDGVEAHLFDLSTKLSIAAQAGENGRRGRVPYILSSCTITLHPTAVSVDLFDAL